MQTNIFLMGDIMAKFNVGDTVQLKSGGPAMTVEEVPPDGREKYACIWFKGASKERGVFVEETLKKYEQPKAP